MSFAQFISPGLYQMATELLQVSGVSLLRTPNQTKLCARGKQNDLFYRVYLHLWIPGRGFQPFYPLVKA